MMELKKVLKRLVCPLFILVGMVSLVGSVMAAEQALTELVLFNEDMVSGVTKRAEKTYEAAANVTIIPGKFLERYAIRNINDLFEVIEGGWHTMKGADEVLVLRGVSGYANDKILFLYDGMLFPTFLGLGENHWPNTFDDVERIEIVKGPNTSVWGGQGTQGTINIVHKGAAQFQGLNTSVVVGKYQMARYNVNYVQKPTADLNYQFLVNSTYFRGWKGYKEEWGGKSYADRGWDGADLVNPIPDYQIFANVNYKDVTMAYRRLEERVLLTEQESTNVIRKKHIENYADDVNFILRKPEYWKNTDWTTTVKFNNFYQMYDVFHINKEATEATHYEMKTEKRWELDSNVLMNPDDKTSIVLGAQVGVWSPQGSGPSVYWNPWTRNNDAGPTSIYATPEFLPTLTEMGNDIAAAEGYVDAKYQLMDNLSLTGGGRYVGEFNPGDQFRDEREKLHKFFPKLAVVYSPLEKLYLKGLYQTSFTRLNTFERYSSQNNMDKRGSQKATTSESAELVVDFRPVKNMKALVSYYHMILYDFVNFVYTGPGWPAMAPGAFRGFFNVGDHQANGIEANVSYDYNNMGGFISGSQLLKNKIANITPGLAGGSGVIGQEIAADFNKSSVPRCNMAIGAYYDITENYSASGIYKMHKKIQVRGRRPDDNFPWDTPPGPRGSDEGYYWDGGGQLDLVATAKNVGIKNLNISIIGKNVLNAIWYTGSAMDPEHTVQIMPQYFEAKVSYLW
ncbi:MAG: TonB-dependent receptor [Elusimicrobia bacterium]|nr:TonB-dependent receptor [Elusimicrobiota bacterium]